MSFSEGEESERECPVCKDGTMMVSEMSFQDCYSYGTNEGRIIDYNKLDYTVDCPLLVCPKCDYEEDYEEYPEEDDGNY